MLKIMKPHACKAKQAMADKLAALQGGEVTVEYSPALVGQLTGRRDLTIEASCHPNKLGGLFQAARLFCPVPR